MEYIHGTLQSLIVVPKGLQAFGNLLPSSGIVYLHYSTTRMSVSCYRMVVLLCMKVLLFFFPIFFLEYTTFPKNFPFSQKFPGSIHKNIPSYLLFYFMTTNLRFLSLMTFYNAFYENITLGQMFYAFVPCCKKILDRSTKIFRYTYCPTF